MESRLEEAALSGDVAALRRLLEEDKLILHREAASLAVGDGPLHVAALIGHVELTRELLRCAPWLAVEVNPRGLSPLHLASAGGHSGVVGELLRAGSHELCVARDKDGQLPLHAAAARGRAEVMAELLEASPGTARAVTGTGGDGILHLVVKSGSFEAVRFVVGRLGDGEEFLNAGDGRGNTALHLATARRQTQTVKLLLSKPGIRVNASNARGSTPLDVLLETPAEHGDVALAEMLIAAGAKTTTTMDTAGGGGGGGRGGTDLAAPPVANPGSSSPPAAAMRGPWKRRQRRQKVDPGGWSSYTPTTLMVVAVLIATVTFQAGLQPPKELAPVPHASGAPSPGGGEAFSFFQNSDTIPTFLLLDMTALFASICVILLMICAVPPARRWLMGVLVWVVWISVFCTALAFTFGALATYPGFPLVKGYLRLWLGVLVLTVVWQTIRGVLYLARKVLPREKGERWSVCSKRSDEEGQVMEGPALRGVFD